MSTNVSLLAANDNCIGDTYSTRFITCKGIDYWIVLSPLPRNPLSIQLTACSWKILEALWIDRLYFFRSQRIVSLYGKLQKKKYIHAYTHFWDPPDLLSIEKQVFNLFDQILYFHRKFHPKFISFRLSWRVLQQEPISLHPGYFCASLSGKIRNVFSREPLSSVHDNLRERMCTISETEIYKHGYWKLRTSSRKLTGMAKYNLQ